VVPTADGLADIGGICEPELADRAQRFGMILDAGENEAAEWVRKAVAAAEQLVIDVGDRAAVLDQRRVEVFKALETGKRREARARLVSLRDLMRLRVLQHLDAMLDLAE